MEQRNNRQPHIRKLLYQKAFQKKLPINGSFELTPRCNMNCRMCYIRMSQEEMEQRGRLKTAQEWIELGKTCVENGMLFLLLTGGEPFMRRDFKEIYIALHKMGLIISLNTNGTMITEDVIAWLKEYPPSKVNVTLYGSSNTSYERLCGLPGGYDAACRGIHLLQEAGIYVNINSSYTPENVQDMEGIFTYAKAHGMPVSGICYMFPPVRSAKEGVMEENVRFTAREAGIARAWVDRLKMSEAELNIMLNRMEQGIFDYIEDEEDCVRTRDEHMSCIAGGCSFWITWDGRMTPCGMMNAPVVNPFQTGFMEAWKQLTEQAQSICLPGECSGCKIRGACMICGALSMAEGNGDSTKKPEYLCEMTKAYLEEMKSFRKKNTTDISPTSPLQP